MELTKVNEWLQLGAALGVLAGLALIVVEIRQNSDLVRAQLISESTDGWSDFSYSVYDEDIAEALAKVYEDPTALTTAELIKLDHYMWASVSQISREIHLNEMGLLPSWSQFSSDDADLTFGNRFALSWFIENKDSLNIEMAEYMDQYMNEISPDHNADALARIKSNL